MRNSDPRVRNVFVYRFNSNFHSILTLQVAGCDLQHGSNFGVHSNPTFRVSWFFISWQSVLSTSHWICKLWEFVSVLWFEVLSDFDLFSGILHLHKFCSIDLVVEAFPLFPCTSAIKSLCRNLNRRFRCHCQQVCWREQWVRLLCHYGSLRTCLTGTVFLAHIWACSVDTELINRNNCAKNSFNHISIGTEVKR